MSTQMPELAQGYLHSNELQADWTHLWRSSPLASVCPAGLWGRVWGKEGSNPIGWWKNHSDLSAQMLETETRTARPPARFEFQRCWWPLTRYPHLYTCILQISELQERVESLKPLGSPWCYSWCEHFDVSCKTRCEGTGCHGNDA